MYDTDRLIHSARLCVVQGVSALCTARRTRVSTPIFLLTAYVEALASNDACGIPE